LPEAEIVAGQSLANPFAISKTKFQPLCGSQCPCQPDHMSFICLLLDIEIRLRALIVVLLGILGPTSPHCGTANDLLTIIVAINLHLDLIVVCKA
jgi:hypothetical protein